MPEYKNSEMLAIITEYVHNPRYRDILRRRFCDEYKYEEIGMFCNKSRQSIQQAEVRALNRLWKNKALKKFAVYMDKPETFYLEDGTFDVKGYYRRKKASE